MPKLEQHFKLELSDCQPPQFLIYREGDFYEPHCDDNSRPDYPQDIQQRKISIVIFLNGEAEEHKQDSYNGGALTFYGLIADPRCAAIGFPLAGETGLLVAFRSNIFHEVKPVTQGERHTIVSWLF
jgi:SM-20-related protein